MRHLGTLRTQKSAICAMLLLAGTCIQAVPAQTQQVSAGNLMIRASADGTLSAAVADDAGLLHGARLRVYDGKDHQAVALTAKTVTPRGDGLRIAYVTTPGQLDITLDLTPHARCIEWRVTCINHGTAQRWLELGPELLLGSPDRLTLFDGFNTDAGIRDDPNPVAVTKAPAQPFSTDNLRNNFPLTIAWTGRAAVGVGIAAGEIVSYLRHEYRTSPEPVLASYDRIVVDPGREETVTFVTCGTPGEWGKYEVFEAYYDSFPEYFHATPGVDPRVTMGSSEYRAFPVTEWSPEICRRLWAGWEWCYAPFRRTGDIACREEFWNYQPARPFDKRRALPRDQFLAWRRQAFADGESKCNVAMLFYVPSQVWCEERLAHEHYPDALLTDPAVKTYFDTPWVTGNDNELLMFPYGTSFAAQSHKDMQQVATELNLTGFAFDTAEGTARYRGPALPHLEDRAWDDGGVFCNENVAVARLMDWVHTLRNRSGRPLAVVGNVGVGCYSACFHSDSCMFEGEPWKLSRTYADHLRWKTGQKTCVWWESYGLEDFIDVNRATAKQVTAVYRGLADFTLLQSLRLGFIPPPNYTQGFRRLVHWLPAITDCAQTGWQPVPATRVPEPLWCTRYGRDLDTRLALAHETGKPVSATAIVENSRLGDGIHIFAPYYGGSQENRVEQSKKGFRDETALPLFVPVRTPVLLRCVAAITPVDGLRAAAATWTVHPTSATLELSVQAAAGQLHFRVPVPEGMQVNTVQVDGSAIAEKADRDAASFDAAIHDGSHVRVDYVSTIFPSDAGSILNFPFVKDGRSNCTIVLPHGGGTEAQLAAFRLQEYFRYWYGRACTPPTDVRLPIADSAPSGGQAIAALVIKPGAAPHVDVSGDRMTITAPDESGLDAVMLKLLRVLDTKYDFPDVLPATVLNHKLGLANKVIEPE